MLFNSKCCTGAAERQKATTIEGLEIVPQNQIENVKAICDANCSLYAVLLL